MGAKTRSRRSAVQRVEQAVVEHPGGVDDRAQGVLVGDRGEQRLELGAIGDVAGGDRHLGAQLLQLGAQLDGPRCLLARCG